MKKGHRVRRYHNSADFMDSFIHLTADSYIAARGALPDETMYEDAHSELYSFGLRQARGYEQFREAIRGL